MAQQASTNVKAGAFTILALAVFAVAIFTIGSRRQLFEDQYTLRTSFANIAGLATAAPVRLAGQDVGVVEEIRFHEDLAVKRVQVTLKVNRSVQDRIRSDSKASIETAGLLGDKYVAITMGGLDARILENGEFIDPVDPIDLGAAVARGTKVLDTLASISENVDVTIKEFRESGALLDLEDSFASLKNIIASIEHDDREILGNLSKSMASLREIIDEVRAGDGTANAIIYGKDGKAVIAELRATAEEITTLVTAIRQEKRGLLHQLVYAQEGDTLLDDLEKTAGSLQRIAAKIDEGEGTMGALVNDPAVYEDLREALGGAKRSLAIRALISLSKAALPEDEEPEPPPPPPGRRARDAAAAEADAPRIGPGVATEAEGEAAAAPDAPPAEKAPPAP